MRRSSFVKCAASGKSLPTVAFSQITPPKWFRAWQPSISIKLSLSHGHTPALVQSKIGDDGNTAKEHRTSPLGNIRQRLLTIFLPRDYRHSVTPNYITFVKWHIISSVSGTVLSVLSTQALLISAMGPAATSTTAATIPIAAATLNWVIKDGLGLFGGVVYTSLVSDRFDSEPKRFRFRAAVALNLATLCELLTPFAPSMFLLTASLSNIAKNIAWLALSGTRARMHSSFCRKDNLGDVTAKSGSQSTAAGLLGTGFGVALAAVCGTSPQVALTAYLPLVALSLYGVYRSNCVVIINSFDRQRIDLLIYHYLQTGQVLTPKQVADKEAFVGAFKPLFPCQLDICPPISRLRDELLKCQDDSDGLIRDLTNKGWLAIRSGNSVKLWLTKHCSVESLLAGYYEACRLRDSFDINVHQSDTSLLIDGIRLAGWNINEIRLCDENQLLVMQNK